MVVITYGQEYLQEESTQMDLAERKRVSGRMHTALAKVPRAAAEWQANLTNT